MGDPAMLNTQLNSLSPIGFFFHFHFPTISQDNCDACHMAKNIKDKAEGYVQ
jgi:hypothetical protein